MKRNSGLLRWAILLPARRQLRRQVFLVVGLGCFISQAGFAQSSNQAGWQAQVETGSWVATGQTQPFWLWAESVRNCTAHHASRNYGTFSNPYPVPYGQLSALASVQWLLPQLVKTQLTASLAMDQGQLPPNIVGGFVGLRKRW